MNYELEIQKAETNNPVVDINMPTYQHASFLAEAIESVLVQRTQYVYRLIITDDGSNDGSQEIMAQSQILCDG